MTTPTVNPDYRATIHSGHEGYIEALFIQMTTPYPFSAYRYVNTGEKNLNPQDYLPAGFEVVRYHQQGETLPRVEVIARSETALVLMRAYSTSYVEITAAAGSADAAKGLVDEIHKKIPQPKIDEDHIALNLWQASEGGASSTSKQVEAPAWIDIERNYAAKTREAVTSLMKTDKLEDGNGKIILWHGPPGTGKTSAIRALAREWKKWCSVHYISDPEKMFNSPGYLLKVGAHSSKDYRLIIAEDTDEFLRVDAKAKSGAALSRLLNFSDGLLGQGCKVLFLLTTNEPIGKLQPALLRPGRCLAQTEFTPMSGAEVMEWLPEGHEPPVGNKTLAELYEHIADRQQQINTGFGKTNPIGFGA